MSSMTVHELEELRAELTRFRAELADARKAYGLAVVEANDVRAELAQAKADAAAWNKSFHDANTERMRLRAALEHVVKADDEAISELRARGIVAADYDPVVAKIAREALATPAPVAPPICPHLRGSDEGTQWCALAESAIMVPLADAEALATAIEKAGHKNRTGISECGLCIALAAYRSRHAAPKEPLP